MTMMRIIHGRSQTAVLIIVAALFAVVDIGSRILAPLLQRAHASRAAVMVLAWLITGGIYGWSVLWWALPLLGAVMTRGSFGDLLDVRFREVIADRMAFLRNEDMTPILWNIKPPTTPQRDTERYSQVSGLPRAGQFTGSIDYAQRYQGYDLTATYAELAQGVQFERTLLEYDQF